LGALVSFEVIKPSKGKKEKDSYGFRYRDEDGDL
jgi:hypothetical protein